jgi:hypothetical protein
LGAIRSVHLMIGLYRIHALKLARKLLI